MCYDTVEDLVTASMHVTGFFSTSLAVLAPVSVFQPPVRFSADFISRKTDSTDVLIVPVSSVSFLGVERSSISLCRRSEQAQ